MTVDFRPHAEKIREFFAGILVDVTVDVNKFSLQARCVMRKSLKNTGIRFAGLARNGAIGT